MRLRLATRGSKLAWGQSGQVADALRGLGHDVEMVLVTTHGDVTTAPLASLGGAGVFVGAVRAAVLSGECDFAVHSFKDLPTAPATGLTLAAVPPREDPADALCTTDQRRLVDLPAGARVGTGSPRRAAQLLALRPDLTTVEIRGNVETRLARAGADLDAVVLAAAGLTRMGLADRISERFDPGIFLPAPSQGALAIECRSDDAEVLAALGALDDPATRLTALAERSVLAGLQAGCAAPVGAYATVIEGRLRLTAAVISTDGARRLTEQSDTDDLTLAGAAALGTVITQRLVADGAAALVELAATKPKPLAGRRLLLPNRCPTGLADALISAGARVSQVEFTRQEALPLVELDAAIENGFDWVVVSSSFTVEALASQGFDLGRLRAGRARIAAVGPATAARLSAAGLTPDLVARPGGGAALVAAFESGPGTVLLPGAEDPSTEPGAGLAAKGWDVRKVAVYRTVPGVLSESVRHEWTHCDAFIATAGSVVRAAAQAGVPGPGVIAIGASTAAAARAAGLSVLEVANTPDVGGLVDAVLAALG
jgi:hydroxymethylbilane synthase